MKRVAIVGAGIAGLACAKKLQERGSEVVLFDKGRGTGGRMSSRRVNTSQGAASFDHGAQYFTVREAAFLDEVRHWQKAGLAEPWAEAGADAWVGVPTMNAPLKHLAEHLDVRHLHHVDGLMHGRDGWWVKVGPEKFGPFDAAIIAVPAEQAAALVGLHDIAMATHAMMARSQPCWTAMIAFGDRLSIDGDHLRNRGLISWAARNSAKPGRDGPESWVVQAGGNWSARNVEMEAPIVAGVLLDALVAEAKTAAPEILSIAAHRWRFAMTRGADQGSLWNARLQLGACGDWLLGPRVEFAWLSGRSLADMMTQGAAARPMVASRPHA
ncbi:NAD(P)/FAD-dependent oxidoreductase [Rhizorhabdus sp. FW153]|uniref:NAD(P)/FAD-dependent oxidoreductase n=1 Tax=Rhizorhabdus sp. FW153 TaxID=3400216 RepID=UPI003CF8DBED